MSSEQKDALMELCRVHVHSQVTFVLHQGALAVDIILFVLIGCSDRIPELFKCLKRSLNT